MNRDDNKKAEHTPQKGSGQPRLMRQIHLFYEANPGTLFRPRDLRAHIGAGEKEIAQACKQLMAQGVLIEEFSGPDKTYRLRKY